MGQVCEHACCAARGVVYPTRNGHQLLVLVRRRVRVPIHHSQAQLRMVEQVQLRTGAALDCGLCLHVAISCDGA